MNATPLISVVIATRDRRDSLTRCLDALATSGAQFGAAWQAIVVDNGSSDATAAFLAERRAQGDLPLDLVMEATPGLAVARNAGLAKARGEIIAFTDDDCLVEQDWLTSMATAYRETAAADAIGGWVGLNDPADLPISIRTALEPVWITDSMHALAQLIGCNFSARAAALRRVGPFDPLLGAGSAAQSAEDLDLFHRMLRLGLRLRYDPSMRLRHAHGRRDPLALRRLQDGYVMGRGAFYAKHIRAGDRGVLAQAACEIPRLARGKQRRLLKPLMRGAWLRMTGR